MITRDTLARARAQCSRHLLGLGSLPWLFGDNFLQDSAAGSRPPAWPAAECPVAQALLGVGCFRPGAVSLGGDRMMAQGGQRSSPGPLRGRTARGLLCCSWEKVKAFHVIYRVRTLQRSHPPPPLGLCVVFQRGRAWRASVSWAGSPGGSGELGSGPGSPLPSSLPSWV